ncbi:MAG: FAD-dependent oxidoreductase [Acidobacteriota bacterium]
MERDLRRLAGRRFDLLVIGAGVYGAAAAWHAALAGLSVAIIDQDDFGAATSANSLKTLHGGLRSLQSLDVRQMRLFIRERRRLAQLAPHLVRVLPFCVPTYRNPVRGRLAMRVALALNDLVSRDRNDDIDDPGLHIPGGAIVSRTECLELNPVIDPKGVTGGAVWYDYQAQNADRLTFGFIRSAVDAGAAAANYVRADGFLTADRRVTGVTAEDRLTGETLEIRARVVLNAGGPWAATLLGLLPGAPPAPAPRLSRAMNLVTRRVTRAHACGGLAGGRFLFLAPWRNVSILGTSHDAHEAVPDALRVSRWDIEALLADAREAFPHAGLTAADVRLVHRGLLPMVRGEGSRVRLLRESVIVDHRRQKLGGLISMFGVRYTTACDTADRAIDVAFAQLDRARPAAPPAHLAGGGIANMASFLNAVYLRDVDGISQDTLDRLARTYGTEYDRVLQIVRDEPELAAPLGESCPVTGAEIAYAVRSEAAVKLGDALLRRTEAGSAGHPGSDAIERAGQIMAGALGWDEWTLRNEIGEVEAFFRQPG